jgi:uncharacterized phage-associated protein
MTHRGESSGGDEIKMTESQLKYRPKYEKIVELLLYLAHKRPNADHYQAVKFLYLADKEHLNRYARPITFEKYCALPFGPVASNALNLLKGHAGTLERFGISELPFEIEKLDKIIYIKAPKRAVNYEVFSKSDIEVFDQIIKEYGHLSFGDLYNITHSHFAYKNAWSLRSNNSHPISYDDMMEESPKKASFIDDFSSVSSYM